MQKFAQLMMTLAVVLFATSPIVDCCFNGHSSASTEVAAQDVSAKADIPPCHGGAEDNEPVPAAPTGDDGCGGCANCDTALAHIDPYADEAVATTLDHVKLSAVANAPAQPVARPVAYLATVPARAPPRANASPVSLKQRLLI